MAYGADQREMMEYEDFLDALSMSMIFNDLDNSTTHIHGKRKANSEQTGKESVIK